jgi:putative ABC transport system ATP-binding protein
MPKSGRRPMTSERARRSLDGRQHPFAEEAPMPALISLRGVTKVYDGAAQPALDAIDLDIEAGRITAIIGPSGCGKSTLLNLVGGLDRPTRGEIIVAGTRVDQLGESAAATFRRASVGYVFQFFHLLDDLSVAENVLVAAQLAGTSRTEVDHRVAELLGQLGLSARAKAYPATLSGGERQRVAIARAIVNRPTVLLADEPTGALDRQNGESALALLEDLNRHGQTILLVTHDEALAQRQAHRIVRLLDGRIAGDRSARLVA